MGNKLPRKLEQKMQTVGEQIKLARLRRNLSVAQVAERATCSPLTVVDRCTNRERHPYGCYWYLSASALCLAT